MRKKSPKVMNWLIKTFTSFIPPIVMLFLYSTVPSIPFVKIHVVAYVFVAILFVAAILIMFKLKVGPILGISGCIFAFIVSSFLNGEVDMRSLLFCSIICIYYIWCIVDMYENK